MATAVVGEDIIVAGAAAVDGLAANDQRKQKLYNDLFEAVRRNDLATTQRLFEEHKLSVNAVDQMGNTPMYYAALCGHLGLLSYLRIIGGKAGTTKADEERAWMNALNINARRIIKLDNNNSPNTSHRKSPRQTPVASRPTRNAPVPKPKARKTLPALCYDGELDGKGAQELLDGHGGVDANDDNDDDKDGCLSAAVLDNTLPASPTETLASMFPYIDQDVVALVLEEHDHSLERAADALARMVADTPADLEVDDFDLVSKSVSASALPVPAPEHAKDDFPPLPSTVIEPAAPAPETSSPAMTTDLASIVQHASATWVAVSAAALALLPRLTPAAEPVEVAPQAATPDVQPAVSNSVLKGIEDDDWDVLSSGEVDESTPTALVPKLATGALSATVSSAGDSFHALSNAEEVASEQFSVVSEVSNHDDLDDFDVHSVSSTAPEDQRTDISDNRMSYSAAAKTAMAMAINTPPRHGPICAKPAITKPTGAKKAAPVPASAMEDQNSQRVPVGAGTIVDAETMYYQQKTDGLNTSRKNPRTQRRGHKDRKRGSNAAASQRVY